MSFLKPLPDTNETVQDVREGGHKTKSVVPATAVVVIIAVLVIAVATVFVDVACIFFAPEQRS